MSDFIYIGIHTYRKLNSSFAPPLPLTNSGYFGIYNYSVLDSCHSCKHKFLIFKPTSRLRVKEDGMALPYVEDFPFLLNQRRKIINSIFVHNIYRVDLKLNHTFCDTTFFCLFQCHPLCLQVLLCLLTSFITIS